MYYDLHIHSALSPCADDDMTICNIINMSIIKELDMISITDHNSFKQYASIMEICHEFPIKILIGAEIQTKEDIHACVYFKNYADALAFQTIIDAKHPKIKNRKDYFGNQLILNSDDLIKEEEELLLLVSLDISINELSQIVHTLNGSLVLAHVLDRGNSIITQLGFIPFDLEYDGIEVKDEKQKLEVIKTHPWLKPNVLWLYNSDAHHLGDINERKEQIDDIDLKQFWRESR